MNHRPLKPHISINVENLDRSTDFYRRMLGIEPVKVRPGYAKFDVSEPPLNLALNEVSAPVVSGALSHLGFQVSSAEEVLAFRELWTESGLLTRDEMQTDCCYARQDKTWVSDPDGNAWEVFVVLEDDLPEAKGSTDCCASGAPR
ncbi:MAG: ArsI/CadI family heavy metal resistance metalloenzyme [Thermoanaerobaculia bacterium]|nr:ArsI/CadI family heavy metal resistance metalloenzyme [Thermoanaerobaculia bacterium]